MQRKPDFIVDSTTHGTQHRYGADGPESLSHNQPLLPHPADNNLPPQQILNEVTLGRSSYLRALGEVTHSINVLRITLDALERERSRLHKELIPYNTVLSPLRHIPGDVLLEIFRYCLRTHRYPTISIHESPLLLTRICKKWRSISLAAPLLWNKIHVKYHQSYNSIWTTTPPSMATFEGWAMYNNSLQTWLMRSMPLPLCLSIHPHHDATQNHEPDNILTSTAHQTFSVIAHHVNRLGTMEFVGKGGILTFVNSLMRARGIHIFPLLKRLQLSIESPWVCSDPSFSSFPSSPLLRSVSIDSRSIGTATQLLGRDFLWYQLGELFLHTELFASQVLDLLKRTPLLQVLSLRGARRQGPGDPSLLPLQLSNLKSLNIEGSCQSVGDICHYLITPSLTHLSLNLYSYAMFEADHDDDALPQPGAQPSTSEIVSFLHHTSPSKLTLKPWNLTSSEIQAIFQAASAVTSLTIDQSLITHLDPSFRGVFQNALLTSRDRYTLREASARVLYPLLTQERWSIIGGIPERAYILKKPLLSELVSFTIIEDIESQLPILPSSVEVLVSFLKGRIHGELIDHDTMSLRNVNLVLRERPNDTVDLMADMARHMESVGRNIGRDITLNVSYRKSSEIYAHVDVDALQPDNEQDVIFMKVEDKSTWDYHMQFRCDRPITQLKGLSVV